MIQPPDYTPLDHQIDLDAELLSDLENTAIAAAERAGAYVAGKFGGVLAVEEKNDAGFGRKLAALSEVYINDAFGAAHRAHASTEAIARFAPVSAAGLLMERELDYLRQATENPAKPYVAIVGGAKVSDKITVIENLLDLVDTLIIGGGMAYTFMKAQGLEIGNSLLDVPGKW